MEATAVNGLRLSEVDLKAVALRDVKLGHEDDCAPGNLIALDLVDANLQVADFSRIELLGKINLARFTVPSQQFLFDWGQVYPRLIAAESRVDEVDSCAGRSVIIAAEDNRLDKVDALGAIEMALSQRERVYDANEAYFKKSCLEESSDVQCRGLVVWSWVPVPITEAISACGSARWEDCIWGYGVRPWRLAVWLVLMTLMASVALFFSPRNIIPNEDIPRWRFQPRKIANVGPTAIGSRRVLTGWRRGLGGLLVVTQAETSIMLGRVCIEAPNESWWVRFLWIIRFIALGLIALLLISVARSWPWLYKLLEEIGRLVS